MLLLRTAHVSSTFEFGAVPDEEADRGNDSTTEARVADLLVNAFELIFLRAETEVLNTAMGKHQNIARLLQGGLEMIEALHFEINVAQAIIGYAAQVAGSTESQP